LSATKSAEDDKRGFSDVGVKPESGGQNRFFRNSGNLFPKIKNVHFLH